MDYFMQRLAQAEERIFSHVNLYRRAKLIEDKTSGSIRTVYNVHSVLGSSEPKLVFGIINQKEDGHYYLEDSTYTMKINFSNLEYVEPDAYFTETCVILAEGKHENGMFYLQKVMHPPLHANKKLKFHLNE